VAVLPFIKPVPPQDLAHGTLMNAQTV